MGYSSDKYVEQVVGAASVTEIFNEWGEAYFRDNEVSLKRTDFISCCILPYFLFVFLCFFLFSK